MSYDEKLESAGYKIPVTVNKRIFEAGVKTGNLIFVSGNAAKVDGVLKYKGIVGDTVSMEQAQDAAKIAFVNCLATVRNMTGSLANIKKIVNIKGYVACTPNFIEQPEVMDEVSALAIEVFGDAGKHSRVSLGASCLPGGTPVEVEIVVEVE
ncbi:RidA family protein [Sporosarcina sp. JAI121]|uniref:RidA family protein n=1 Tax=Sporosarcina sp. JAI121 TaxID=2723064 RepID=UPI0015C79D16|nr:RidA family protein [Sporosarcina sp. JAI121]NYF25628.1 enamine deaminase RidA (YjgF/YER057c/UK114 family) [Sporosarcina sp. JAI121]